MNIATIIEKIRQADKESKDIIATGVQGYQDSIDNLQAITKLCKYAIMLLEKCRKEDVPFQDYELIIREGTGESDA